MMEVLYVTNADADGNRFLIGELTKTNEGYTFRYTPDAPGKSEGFIKIPTFTELDREYVSKNLFLFFGSRLIDKARPDLPQILESYNLDSYDDWNLLKASRGRLMIDRYELLPNSSSIGEG